MKISSSKKDILYVVMFSNLKVYHVKVDQKVMLYHYLKTSHGESEASFILKLENTYQVVGVHRGHEMRYNLCTSIKSVSNESLREIFSFNDDQENFFDKYLIE
jgi:hypothetical protein